MLADRIRQALSVLGGDNTVEGTLREQATAYLGELVDERCLSYVIQSAQVIYDDTRARADEGNFPADISHRTALANVLLGGMAIGKRLGIEDGERFARSIKQ